MIKRINDYIYFIDPLDMDPPFASGIYVVAGDVVALVETSSSIVARHIPHALAELGLKERDLAYIIVTHVHLDHAGGAGWLVDRMPWARVYVHERGARHLVDPARLLASAEAVYGSMQAVIDLHGEVLPVKQENVEGVSEHVLELGGGVSLRIFDAPGHAPHHVCILEEKSRYLFCGEAVGHYHPDSGGLSPAVAPPSFSMEDSLETLDKIHRLAPQGLLFSQYGKNDDVAVTLDEAVRQLKFYDEFIRNNLAAGKSQESIVRELMAKAQGNVSFEGLPVLQQFSNFQSIVSGFVQYYDSVRQSKVL